MNVSRWQKQHEARCKRTCIVAPPSKVARRCEAHQQNIHSERKYKELSVGRKPAAKLLHALNESLWAGSAFATLAATLTAVRAAHRRPCLRHLLGIGFGGSDDGQQRRPLRVVVGGCPLDQLGISQEQQLVRNCVRCRLWPRAQRSRWRHQRCWPQI